MIIAFGDAILFAKLHGRQVAAPTALNDKGAINSILIYATRHAFACLAFYCCIRMTARPGAVSARVLSR